MKDKILSENVRLKIKFASIRNLSFGFCKQALGYRKVTLFGFLFALAFFTVVSTVSAQPAMSRGEQRLSIGYDECIRRAEQAYIAEGWVNIGKGGAFVNAFKDIHGAYIMCNVAPENKIWVNIVVASLSKDDNVPGAERVKLQERMGQSSNGNNATSTWSLVCCSQKYRATVTLIQNGTKINGSFDDGTQIEGEIRGNILIFRRRLSSGTQDYVLELSADGKTLTGTFSGTRDTSVGVETTLTKISR